MTLAKKTTIGIIWNFTEQIARNGITALITLMLAWFLVPADYGLVAMMAVFLAIANSLMDSGFRQALIRFQRATLADFNTALCQPRFINHCLFDNFFKHTTYHIRLHIPGA